MKQKVIAAMSGGVDSSVAAALLKEQGYDVIGITLNVWPSDESKLACAKTCCSVTDVDDARRVCYRLEIPHYVLNMRDAFRKNVIDYFLGEYLRGRTPNPCIACNEHIKFDALMKKAEALGADYVATGHYAEIVPGASGGFCLRRSQDARKDQTYVLYTLSQRQLSRLLFPCGVYTKDEVRRIAEKYGLPTSHKADSQDICFIGNEGYAQFIRKNCGGLVRPGKVVSTDGTLLGEHDGIFNFTVGQRKGLGKYTNRRSFVTSIDAQSATVVLGEEKDLYSEGLFAGDLRVMQPGSLTEGADVRVKIRYGAPEAPAVIREIEGNAVSVGFKEPQRAVTPGQAAVFYRDDAVLGGATITRAWESPEQEAPKGAFLAASSGDAL